MENYKNTREVLTALSKGTIDDEIKAWAQSQIEKLDARNAKRASKPSKVAEANAPLKEAIFNYLCENTDKKFTEVELGTVINASHNKAGSLVRQLVAEGKASTEEAKFPKIGKRKVYFVAR